MAKGIGRTTLPLRTLSKNNPAPTNATNVFNPGLVMSIVVHAKAKAATVKSRI